MSRYLTQPAQMPVSGEPATLSAASCGPSSPTPCPGQLFPPARPEMAPDVREIARGCAQAIGEGHATRLPRLTRAATPEYAYALLLAFYRLRDAAIDQRQALSSTADLRDRVAIAAVLDEIDSAILDARRWLSRKARRGGAG